MMQVFELSALLEEQAKAPELYREFLRSPALSMGVYVLPVGTEDLQTPHAEDEVYVVLSGQAMLNVAGEDTAVANGSVVYVPAHVPHHFHTIRQDLATLVFFAPAESLDHE